jgi:hypothetical protein
MRRQMTVRITFKALDNLHHMVDKCEEAHLESATPSRELSDSIEEAKRAIKLLKKAHRKGFAE